MPKFREEGETMSEPTEPKTLQYVWNTDAPRGQAWICPDCDSWATIGGNAGLHVTTTGHRLPTLGVPPSLEKDPSSTPQNTLAPCPQEWTAHNDKGELGLTSIVCGEKWLAVSIPSRDAHQLIAAHNASNDYRKRGATMSEPTEPKWAEKLAECLQLLVVTCMDQKSWEEATTLLREYYAAHDTPQSGAESENARIMRSIMRPPIINHPPKG